MKRVIDITLAINPDLPLWPGTPGLEVSQVARLDKDGYNETRISLGSHLGTHVDAPSHFLESEVTVDKLPLDVLLGEAYVVDLQGVAVITADVLAQTQLPSECKRLLFKTDNSRLWSNKRLSFQENYVALTSDGAEWIVRHGIKLVGIDYLSIQRYRDSSETHTALLGEGVVVLEGVNLAHVAAGCYELICLPLPIVGAEGAPARAVLRSM